MSRRAILAGAVLVAWVVGIAFLIRREYFRPQIERLAEAAARVNPAAVYYGVMQGDRQIGFASSTLDTASATVTVNDYFVADLPIGGKTHRASARTNVTLSRGLHMKAFDLALETEGAPIHAAGRVESDSVLALEITTGTEKPQTQRIALKGPILLPTLLPLAVALGEKPKVGKRYVLPVFDPTTMAPKEVALNVRAESAFVVNDSAVYDSSTARWRGIQPDTIHAWRIVSESSGGFSGWIDEQGRIVSTTQLGLELRRLPYEVAFENWRNDSSHTVVTVDRDILETTAIAANARIPDRRLRRLVVRLSNVDLKGFDLDGERQHFQPAKDGGTLIVDSLQRGWIRNRFFRLPSTQPVEKAYTLPEPLIESGDPRIKELGIRLSQMSGNMSVATVSRMLQWVHDSVRKRITFGVPSAIQVYDSRIGDCNEHTALFVALARAAGIPARVASGLVLIDGKFYYHAWPEVYLNDWIAVDPTLGQFPADASHLRFIIGGLGRQAELLRLMGKLKIDVVSAEGR